MNKKPAFQTLMSYVDCEDLYLSMLSEFPDKEKFIVQKFYERKGDNYGIKRNPHKRQPVFAKFILLEIKEELTKKQNEQNANGTGGAGQPLQEIPTTLPECLEESDTTETTVVPSDEPDEGMLPWEEGGEETAPPEAGEDKLPKEGAGNGKPVKKPAAPRTTETKQAGDGR